MISKPSMRADLADEREAVRTYGARAKASTGAQRTMYRELQHDEQTHAATLSRALHPGRNLGKFLHAKKGR
jgi:rubrerythrin